MIMDMMVDIILNSKKLIQINSIPEDALFFLFCISEQINICNQNQLIMYYLSSQICHAQLFAGLKSFSNHCA